MQGLIDKVKANFKASWAVIAETYNAVNKSFGDMKVKIQEIWK